MQIVRMKQKKKKLQKKKKKRETSKTEKSKSSKRKHFVFFYFVFLFHLVSRLSTLFFVAFQHFCLFDFIFFKSFCIYLIFQLLSFVFISCRFHIFTLFFFFSTFFCFTFEFCFICVYIAPFSFDLFLFNYGSLVFCLYSIFKKVHKKMDRIERSNQTG